MRTWQGNPLDGVHPSTPVMFVHLPDERERELPSAITVQSLP